MNSFLCLSLLFAVASAAPKPQSWAYSTEEALKPSSSWAEGGGVQYGYWPSYLSGIQSAEVAPKFLLKGYQQSIPVARADSTEWKLESPVSWSDASYVPQSWSAGYYSAGLPVSAKVEKQIVAKKVVAPVKFDQVQPIADSTPKLISYTTEITHDVPAKKEETIIPASRTIAIAPQVAPAAPKIVSSPIQYSAWSGEVKPVSEIKPASWATEVKPATWTSEVKPASWVSEVKPASWVSEVKPAPIQYSAWSGETKPVSEIKPVSWTSEIKPATWTSEVKPASWSWAEPKPASWAAYSSETKPTSWASWSEPKPYSYVAPIQPSFYGASWGQPSVSTNAHHAISAPWSSGWSSNHPVSWTEPILKRSERKPF